MVSFLLRCFLRRKFDGDLGMEDPDRIPPFPHRPSNRRDGPIDRSFKEHTVSMLDDDQFIEVDHRVVETKGEASPGRSFDDLDLLTVDLGDGTTSADRFVILKPVEAFGGHVVLLPDDATGPQIA